MHSNESPLSQYEAAAASIGGDMNPNQELIDLCAQLSNIDISDLSESVFEGNQNDLAVRLHLFKDALANVNKLLLQCKGEQRLNIIEEGKRFFAEFMLLIKDEKNKVKIQHMKHLFATTSIENVHLYSLLALNLAKKCLKQADVLDDVQLAFSWNREADMFCDKSRKACLKQTLQQKQDEHTTQEYVKLKEKIIR